MEGSIFFKDKNNELKGPFTERQVQEWYRTGWFDSSTMFHTVGSGKNAKELDEKKEFSLATLISLNGIGCPFVDFQKPDQHGFEAEKLGGIEKEIAGLRVQCETAVDVEKRLEELEKLAKDLEVASAEKASKIQKDMEKKQAPIVAPEEPNTVLVTRYKEEPFPKKIGKVPERAMEAYWELADDLTPYVMDGLALYASGEYKNWNKARSQSKVSTLIQLNGAQHEETKRARNAVVTYHLFEEMKHRDFFCCFFCKAVVFNYKQMLIHLESDEHFANESPAMINSYLPDVKYVVKYVTPAPFLWNNADVEAEKGRLNKYGKAEKAGGGVRPSTKFMGKFRAKYDHLIKNDSSYDFSITMRARLAVQNVKGPMGRQAMIELDEHIGDGKTACFGCGMNTGGREEFYAHLISSVHLRKIAESSNLFDLVTILVNVYRKDLV